MFEKTDSLLLIQCNTLKKGNNKYCKAYFLITLS